MLGWFSRVVSSSPLSTCVFRPDPALSGGDMGCTQAEDSRELTQMIHHQRLTPFTPSRARLLSPRPIGNPSIQQQVVNALLLLAELFQRLIGEPLDSLEIRQLQRQDLKRVGGQGPGLGECSSVCILRAGHIAGAEDEVVRLRGLGEEMLDYVEALCRWRGC